MLPTLYKSCRHYTKAADIIQRKKLNIVNGERIKQLKLYLIKRNCNCLYIHIKTSIYIYLWHGDLIAFGFVKRHEPRCLSGCLRLMQIILVVSTK